MQNNKKKLILLNSPPEAGKDTIAKEFKKLYGFKPMEFKEPLYQAAADLIGWDVKAIKQLATSRGTKETVLGFPFPLVPGGGEMKLLCTPRQFLIFTSEHVIKPLKGDKWFGRQLALKVKDNNTHVISDCGFPSEVAGLIEELDKDYEIIVARFTRKGFEDFPLTDSRSWVTEDKVKPLLESNKRRKVRYIDFTNDEEPKKVVENLIKKLKIEV